MKVVDASIGVKWLVPEPDSPKALSLYGDVLHVPDHFPIEVANALHSAEKGGRITEAQTLLGDLLIYLPQLHGTVALLPRALEIAVKARRSVYDALYVALAEREGCDFVTADLKLVGALQKEFPFVVSLDSVQP